MVILNNLKSIFDHKKLALFFFLMINTISFGEIVQARPVNYWRTRNTNYNNVSQCKQKAINTMEFYPDWFNWQESDNFAIKATSPNDTVYILCLNNGSQVAIYCVSDRSDILETCNNITNRMTRN